MAERDKVSLYIDLAQDYKGICDGVVPNQLVVAPANGESLEQMITEIEALSFKKQCARYFYDYD